jgi:hypothetical protein
MRRLLSTTVYAALAVATVAAAARPALAADLCVAAKPDCFAAIQAAVDAAKDGDTIRIGPGTFAGGITILKSVDLVGVSAGATRIESGGPVLTIGAFGGTARPTVAISRVTISGGANDSRPDTGVPAGGGVWIPPSDGNATGATVSISDSVVTRNAVAPLAAIPPGPFCGPFPCAFAVGGGIDNSGALTITDTRISDNDVGPGMASGVFGGGIANHSQGTLVLRRSVVTGNRVAAIAPNGQLAVAGGISDLGALRIEDSVVSDNDVVVEASFPGEANAFTGGIEITGQASATILRTAVRGNAVRATNNAGSVSAGAGGISTEEDITLVLRDSVVAHNSVRATAAAEDGSAVTFAGGVEIEGNVEVSGSSFVGNSVRASAPAGLAAGAGGGIHAASLEPVTVTDSIVASNTVGATTTGGPVIAVGGGVINGGLLTLRRTLVTANSVSATGAFGFAHGGGVQNWAIPLPGFPTDVQLSLLDSVVAGNRLTASPGVERLGGGLFTEFPVTLSGTVIAGNSPDQCSGC